MTKDKPQNKQDENDLQEDDQKGLQWVRLDQEDDNLEGTVWVGALEQCCSVWLGPVSPVLRDVVTDLKVICWDSLTSQKGLQT